MRPHPFEKNVDMPFYVDRSDSTEIAIVNTDVALVQHSTTAIECLSLKTPVIEVMLGGEFLQPLSSINSKIPSIKNDLDFTKIGDVMKTSYIDSFMYRWVDSMIYAPPNREETIDIIVSEIEKCL